eukprot:COSAG06_NODE_55078_length_291_cov_0.817708_1_plen_84_part_10
MKEYDERVRRNVVVTPQQPGDSDTVHTTWQAGGSTGSLVLEPTDSRAPRTWAVVATAKPKAGRPCGGFTYGALERGGDWNKPVA